MLGFIKITIFKYSDFEERIMALDGIVLVPAVVMGIIIGLVEVFFVHADEAGMGWFMHAMHALPFTMLFVFVSMNISFVFSLLNISIVENLWVDLGVRVVIGLIAMFKIAGAAAIVGRVGEKWYHTFIIGVIIILAPYAWDLAGPSITPMLPSWAQ